MPTVNRDYSRPEYTVHLPKARRKKELDDQKKRMLAEQQRAPFSGSAAGFACSWWRESVSDRDFFGMRDCDESFSSLVRL